MTDEILAGWDASGNVLPEGVLRSEAHRRGIWHRTVVVFVLNDAGEILMERRSPKKDLFPGCYDIPGGHVKLGGDPAGTALAEVNEELGLVLTNQRLTRLGEEDSLTERTILLDRGVINFARKTAYLVEITNAEEIAIAQSAAIFSRLSAGELEERGAWGEVSAAQFWNWERLQDTLRDREHRVTASGTESALADDTIRPTLRSRCMELRHKRRETFWLRNQFLLDRRDWTTGGDDILRSLLLGEPAEPATEEQISSIFEYGAKPLDKFALRPNA